MKSKTRKVVNLKSRLLILLAAGCMTQVAVAQTPVITLDFTKPAANVNPMLYGLMTEEINHSYDGGLYGELIRNRVFKDNLNTPEGWSLASEDSNSKAAIKLIAATQDNVPFDERRQAINGALTACLRLTVEKATGR